MCVCAWSDVHHPSGRSPTAPDSVVGLSRRRLQVEVPKKMAAVRPPATPKRCSRVTRSNLVPLTFPSDAGSLDIVLFTIQPPFVVKGRCSLV